jgi:hypothetical protein
VSRSSTGALLRVREHAAQTARADVARAVRAATGASEDVARAASEHARALARVERAGPTAPATARELAADAAWRSRLLGLTVAAALRELEAIRREGEAAVALAGARADLALAEKRRCVAEALRERETMLRRRVRDRAAESEADDRAAAARGQPRAGGPAPSQ